MLWMLEIYDKYTFYPCSGNLHIGYALVLGRPGPQSRVKDKMNPISFWDLVGKPADNPVEVHSVLSSHSHGLPPGAFCFLGKTLVFMICSHEYWVVRGKNSQKLTLFFRDK